MSSELFRKEIEGVMSQATLERIARQILKTMEDTKLSTKNRCILLAQLERIRQNVAKAKKIRAEQRLDRQIDQILRDGTGGAS